MFGIRNHDNRLRRKPPAVVAGVIGAVLALAITVSGSAQAATAIILGTTFLPDSGAPRYIHGAMEYFIKPTTLCGKQSCTVEPVMTPEQFWPLSGWHDLTVKESIAQGLRIVNDTLLQKLADGS